MKDPRPGGLHGKARRARSRSRAARLHAQRSIAELDGDDKEMLFARREIPLGRRNDFFPSVVFSTSTGQDDYEWHGIGTQLQLPLSVLDVPGTGEHGGGIGQVPTRTRNPDHDSDIIRLHRTGRTPMFKQPEQMRDPQQVTLGGFLLGCAMGTAAAGLVLVVLRATVI